MADARSFTAANAGMPVKLLQDCGAVPDGMIFPRHVQLCPTNRCNLKCPFCSCSDREKSLELSRADLEEIINILVDLDTRAVTITGGGEPLLHPEINWLIHECYDSGIRVGLVTNGIEAGQIKQVNQIDWIRISFSDDRKWDDRFAAALANLVISRDNEPHDDHPVDLAFSYVLTAKPNLENLKAMFAFANKHGFTHVRVVTNLIGTGTDRAAAQAAMHKTLRADGFKFADEPLAIWQDRTDYDRGESPCHVSLLRPVIAPDGYVYPCCGVQYAISGETRDFPPRMRMGHWRDLPQIIEGQRAFGGIVCDRCYYKAYNETLAILTAEVKHPEFL